MSSQLDAAFSLAHTGACVSLDEEGKIRTPLLPLTFALVR